MEAQDRTIKNWITQIVTKKLGLPRFQRFESWGPTIINDFLTSMIRGLPVGVSLILKVGNKPQFEYRYFHGTPQSGENLEELLLDGQQRLTALWRCLNDNYEDKTYMIDLNTEEDSGISAIAVSRWLNKKTGLKYPLWADDPVECWERKKIPFRILNPDNQKEFFKWCTDASKGDLTKKDELLQLIIDLREKISTFNIPYLNLPSETLPEIAIDVFIKLNTSYVRLTAFDIIVAQVEEATGQSLHQKLTELETEVPEIRDYINTESYILSVAALLQDKLPNQRGFFSLDLNAMVSEYNKIISGSKELVSLLEEERIYDSDRLPTETILAPIAALLAEMPQNPDKAGNLRILMKQYLWRAFFTERYDRSIPTRILQDFREIKKIIDNSSREQEILIFKEKSFPLPNEELLAGASWPRKKDRLARAILLLSLRKGAKDFADVSEINRKNIKTREYHHLFPLDYLKTNGFKEDDTFKALNCALITWKTNRVISNKEPIKYLLERANATNLGEDEVAYRLSTHLIDYNSLQANNYYDFIEKRAQNYTSIIRELCG